MQATVRIQDPIRIGGLTIPNRLFRAPLLEGAGLSDNPAAIYTKAFVPNAQAGVGLVLQGTVCVTPNGRPSPGMIAIGERADMLAMKPMVDAVHRYNTRIITQLGHGGLYSVESWNNKLSARLSKGNSIAPSLPRGYPRLVAGRPHVLRADEIVALAQRFGEVAMWAREAGYDGVEISGCNGKLIQQFLSRSYNFRDDAYGGSLYRRTRFLREIRQAIGERAGWDFPVLLKFPAVEVGFDHGEGGITTEEGLAIAVIAAEAGYDALTPVAAHASPNPAFSRGDFPSETFTNKRIRKEFEDGMGKAGLWMTKQVVRRVFRNFPFEAVWNRAVFKAVKARVDIPVMAVGGIRTTEEVDQLLADREADMVGIGRPFYAEPDLARYFLAERPAPQNKVLCSNCNQCILPQLIGNYGACYNEDVHRQRALRRKEMMKVRNREAEAEAMVEA